MPRGVRRKLDGRRRPFYARITVRGEFVYSAHYATMEEAAAAFLIMKAWKEILHARPLPP